MVALQRHGQAAPGGGDDAVGLARARVERLAAGLPRALLASHPDDVRLVAARAAEAEALHARRRAGLGPRPDYDDDAASRARHAMAGWRRARVLHRRAVDNCHRTLAMGNAAGVGCLAVAAVLYGAGVEPVAPPVAAAAMAAAGGPITGLVLGLRRLATATRALDAARSAWAAALERTGLETMGGLAARRLAAEAWDRRRRELDVLAEAARRRRRSWQVLAGPGVEPAAVERVVGRLRALRAAQLVLLGALLERRMRGPKAPPGDAATDPPAATTAAVQALVVPIDPRPPAVDADGGPGGPSRAPGPFSRPAPHQRRLEEALERLRNGRLRLWTFRTGA